MKNLNDLWVYVLSHLNPRATRELLLCHSRLLELDVSNELAYIGFISPPLLRMAETRIPNIESAFYAALGVNVKANFQNCKLKPEAENTYLLENKIKNENQSPKGNPKRNEYCSKMSLFAAAFPQCKPTCVAYIDLMFDSSAFADEHYELRFYTRQSINDDATITYKQCGSYRYCRHKKDLDPKSEDINYCYLQEKEHIESFYVERWVPEEGTYHLVSFKPDSKYWGNLLIYDLSLKEGDALVYWTPSKTKGFRLFKELDEITDKLLEEKYKLLEQVAVARGYKPGWIYHKMKEPVENITSLWGRAGFYFPLDSKASIYCSRYKWGHFQEQAEKELQAILEAR